jgi:hypothetical protein
LTLETQCRYQELLPVGELERVDQVKKEAQTVRVPPPPVQEALSWVVLKPQLQVDLSALEEPPLVEVVYRASTAE